LKRNRGKIVLNRETLRAMTVEGPELRRLVGGYVTLNTCGMPCTKLCTQGGCTVFHCPP
jgi:hypothetical protein